MVSSYTKCLGIQVPGDLHIADLVSENRESGEKPERSRRREDESSLKLCHWETGKVFKEDDDSKSEDLPVFTYTRPRGIGQYKEAKYGKQENV